MLHLVGRRCLTGAAAFTTTSWARCDALERHDTENGAAVLRRVTPLKDLEQDVIVLERQVPGEPLQRVSLSDMIDDLSDEKRRLLLFGESHDDDTAQLVERAVYDGVARKRDGRKVSLALEFVPSVSRDRRASPRRRGSALRGLEVSRSLGDLECGHLALREWAPGHLVPLERGRASRAKGRRGFTGPWRSRSRWCRGP